jgi:hypothetical protein
MADKSTMQVIEGEQFTFIVTIKRDGSTVDLTNHMNLGQSGYVRLYIHDDDSGVAAGTNQVDALQATHFAITTTHTTISGSDSDFQGKWNVRFHQEVSGDETEKTFPEDWIIIRDKSEA